MWRNYLVIALRQLARSPAYAAIGIGGLALGLAGCLLILGYVRFEQTYDAWLPDSGNVYQVQSTIHPPGQPPVLTQTSPFPIHERLPADFPQVEAVTSVALGKTVTERDGKPLFLELATVDESFFQVFALPFAQGSPSRALPDLNSVVLTESEAIRQFGAADALGKLISLGAGAGKRDYRVSGVLRDLPPNTNLRLSLIFRRDLSEAAFPSDQRGWGNLNQQHWVKLRPGADAAGLNAALPRWEARVIPPQMIDGKLAAMSDLFDFRLAPIRDVHLGPVREGGWIPGGDRRALATFAIVALLTLGMAVMNFVNLSSARAVQRAREVALRKVLGASRGQLVVQFLTESALMSLAAMLVALSVVELATPWIGRLLGVALHFAYLGEGGMLLPAAALFAITTIVGGLYPALYLSRFKPGQVLRGSWALAETPGSGGVRTTLIVLQFAIAIGLIASTTIIYAQTRFVETVDAGYRRDGLVQIANAWRFTQGGEYAAARTAMLAVPGVTGVGRTRSALASPEKIIRLVRAPGASEYLSMTLYSVDAEFIRTMGIGVAAGRLLGDRFAEDRISTEDPKQLAARGLNVVVNRAAAARLGFKAPRAAVGQVIQVAATGLDVVPSTIVGVVDDTRFGTARDAVDPIVYVYAPEQTNQVVVRYVAARPGEVMAALAKVWRQFEPELPFEARFAEDIVRETYAAERARGVLFAGFAALAVVIACLGLYGLASFATERRTREIGVRKVLGAKVHHIVRLLAWQFSKPVVLANVIAWPVAWWAMRAWLNGFDLRIGLSPAPFLLAGLLALSVALATVAGQSFRVARTNPIHALRYE
ncbi:FtsX-like permease family protein [Sphingomonas sp. IC-56]|uniref:ABC transporter permease n=1 Tax=Sphingomonas sp. IC-56 TaxID=2898529 RepID=UPI001E64000B|nr:ABC transporter permease [Sphingomonas sp. IC-56]MCD2324294.1 FtsX-like permease family protein [Sphingomonas sp. IC-56]